LALRLSLPLAVLLGAASPARAQTTHTVLLGPSDFSPQSLQIQVGDTVFWDWSAGGFHNVESGVAGVFDGNFSSGGPSSTGTFSLTFDAAFLASNPMPANLYPYYCSVHLGVGMVGDVQVLTPASSAVRNGTGVNPLGFAEVSPAVLGGTWMTTVDIATPGHLASLVTISTGGPLPGLMLGGFINGQLLCLPPFLAPDLGFGSHGIPIPADFFLLGVTLCTQGATFNPGTVVLNNAIDITLGV